MKKTLKRADIKGCVRVPASKSQTIRALLIALMAKSESVLHNPLISEDTKACIEMCRLLGADVNITNNKITINSSRVPEKKEYTIDCKNSGSLLFFATAICAALGLKVTFTGDESLCCRSAAPLLNSLVQLGTEVENFDGTGRAPYTICGNFSGGETTIECRTSQYLSALLLACPLVDGDTVINVPLLYEKPYVIMTENWLKSQNIKFETNDERSYYKVYGNQKYSAFEADIKGDFSSASFIFCGAAITGGTVTVKGLDPFDPQGDKGILSILRKMGCKIHWEDDSVSLSGPRDCLEGGTFDLNFMPDAVPALAVAFCFAKGGASITNVPQARLKETDRLTAMASNLKKLGAIVEETEDGLKFISPVTEFREACVDSFKDHRIAMAMAVASLRCPSLTIDNAEFCDVTFPGFYDMFTEITVPVNTTRIISFGDTLKLCECIADKRSEVLKAEDVIENPVILGNFTKIGIVFEKLDTEIDSAVVKFIRTVIGSISLKTLEYLFVVVQSEKPGKSLRIAEILLSKAGCLPSYCNYVGKKDDKKAIEIRKDLDDGKIRIADWAPFVSFYIKHKMKVVKES